MIELQLHNRLTDAQLEPIIGRIVTDAEYSILLTEDARVLTPEGALLCVYRRRALPQELTDQSYDVLHSLRTQTTDNRGLASGSERFTLGDQKRTRSAPVASAIIGAFDATAMQPYCRLTAWTGRELDQYESLAPLFQRMAAVFAEEVPERYAVQAGRAAKTPEAWVVPGTPFTTITVNNTYPTGVHTDKGDLDEGFSCLSCVRRGDYTGGSLVFPRYRVAVDMRNGDQVLMNAHEWHGNTRIEPGVMLAGDVPAERISIVAYYRTEMIRCGGPEREYGKATVHADMRSGALTPELPL